MGFFQLTCLMKTNTRLTLAAFALAWAGLAFTPTGGFPADCSRSPPMRSRARLPEKVKPFPAYLRVAGYYTSNNVKEDYNFVTPPGAWDESSNQAHWRKRAAGQPFFAVFNFTVTHQSQIFCDDATYARNTRRLTPAQRRDPT